MRIKSTGLFLLVLAFVMLAIPAESMAKYHYGVQAGETIKGTNGDDELHGNGGVDFIYGRGGNDLLTGDTALDTIYGGDGDDDISGGSGDDDLYGGNGNDKVTGGFGHDRLYGNSGDDQLWGEGAPDIIYGGAGNDIIHGGAAADDLHGGDGNDQIYSDSGKDNVNAGAGDDVIYFNDGSANGRVDCGPGIDTLHIDIYGVKGGISDRQMVRAGRVVNCENIIETASVVDPLKGITWSASFWGHENKTGTDKNDRLLGKHGSNTLRGLNGDDLLWGDSTHELGGKRAAKQVDHVFGGDGNDTIYGGRGLSVLYGENGDDFIQGGIGRNRIFGGEGNDHIRVPTGLGTTVDAGPGDDKVVAFVTKGRVKVDCGPGYDSIQISKYSFSRLVSHKNCEKVIRG